MQKDPELQKKADILKATPLFTHNSDCYLIEKQMIFLVLAGMKPVSHALSGHMEWISETKRTARADDQEAVEKLLQELGLVYELDVDPIAIGAHVALTKETLQEAKESSKYKTPEDREGEHRYVGYYYGYPKTAADAYADGKTLDPEKKEQLRIERGLDFCLCTFFLSQDHYEEELDVVQKWQDILTLYGLMYDTKD